MIPVEFRGAGAVGLMAVTVSVESVAISRENGPCYVEDLFVAVNIFFFF